MLKITVCRFQGNTMVMCAGSDDKIGCGDCDAFRTSATCHVVCQVPYLVQYRKFRNYFRKISKNFFLLLTSGTVPQFQLD